MRNNDPFKPALARPLSDSDLANDPHPDNFLAGNDGLGRRLNRRMTMDGVMQPELPETPAAPAMVEQPQPVEQPAPSAPAAPDLSNLANLPDAPATPDFSDLSAAPNQDPLNNPLATPNEASTPSVKVLPPEADAAPATGDQSTNLFEQAAQVADNQKKPPKLATPKQKQVTISLLTIIFFLLFLASTGVAVWFGYDNNKKSTALADAQAKLAQSKDYLSDKTNTSTKTSTQFDALQAKIADLTKKNDEAKQQLDEKQKNIDDQNKKIADLTKQNGDFQNKINSDKAISDNMHSLAVTLCASNPSIAGSAPCVQLNSQQQPPQPGH